MHSIPDRRMTYLQSVLSRRPRFVILWLGNDGNGRGTLATVYGATRRQHTAVWRWDKRPWETSSSINVHFRTESNTSWHSAANMDSPLAAPHVSSEASKHLRHESHDTPVLPTCDRPCRSSPTPECYQSNFIRTSISVQIQRG